MEIKSIKQAKNLAGKVVLLRVDFNAPMAKGRVADNYKIIKYLPTIKYLLRQRAKVVLMSHWGNPEFTKQGVVKQKKQFSLLPVFKFLSKKLPGKIFFSQQVLGPSTTAKLAKLEKGQALLLENMRFEPGEVKNSRGLAKRLAKLGDLYVNDALSASHRKQTSVAAIKKYLPAYAGLLLEEEIKNLDKARQPARPLVVIIGGAKLSTKTGVIKHFLKQADQILIGGAMANNFLAARQLPIGKSLADQASIRLAKKLNSPKIILPVDVVVARPPASQARALRAGPPHFKKVRVRPVEAVKKNEMILDIGPETMKNFAPYIKKAQTIVWNGPMGKFESRPFSHGSLFIGRLVASRSQGQAFGLVGGGETIQVLRQTKMFDDVDWVSTGGGAMLVYLSNGKMPGLNKIVKYNSNTTN